MALRTQDPYGARVPAPKNTAPKVTNQNWTPSYQQPQSTPVKNTNPNNWTPSYQQPQSTPVVPVAPKSQEKPTYENTSKNVVPQSPVAQALDNGVNNLAEYFNNTPSTPSTTPSTPSTGGGNSGGGSAPVNPYSYNTGETGVIDISDSGVAIDLPESGSNSSSEEDDKAKQVEYLIALRAALEAQRKAREEAIEEANKVLDRQALDAGFRYNASRSDIENNYQALRNQAAIQNFKARRAQREALADRGALNSGLGLQENLALSSNYNNNLARIGEQEQSAISALRNNYDQYLTQVDLQKANNKNSTLDNYNNTISSLINATFSGYKPDENYLALAQAIAGGMPALTSGDKDTVKSSPYVGGLSNLYELLKTYFSEDEKEEEKKG